MAGRVLYQWTNDDGQEYRVVDSPLGPVPQALYEEAGDIWLGVGDERVGAEILRLSAEPARARAEGRLEGIKDMHTEIHLALSDDTEKDRGHVNKWGLARALRILEVAIAAAERELAGGEEEE